MKKSILLLTLTISFSNIYADELKHVPVILNASDLEKSVTAPKGGCDECEVNKHKASQNLVNPLFRIEPKILKQVEDLKANVACPKKSNRLKNDASFYVKGESLIKSNKLAGHFQPGFLGQGSISKMWVGVSTYGDLMFVTRISNGDKVEGYNVTLSYCEMKNSQDSLPSIVSDLRAIDNFQAPYGIILAEDTECGYGVVDLAQNAMVVSRRDSTNAYSGPDAQVPTSFAKPKCNKQF